MRSMQTQHQFSIHQAILKIQNSLRFLLPLTDLLMRLYIGKLFFWSGLTKLRDWEMTVSLFTDEYRVPLLSPEVAAYLATGAELILPILLVLGLFKSLAACGLFVVNILAVVSYYKVLQGMPAALQDHIEWGLMLLSIACSPAYLVQLDYYWQHRHQVSITN